MGLSKETIASELQHTAKLSKKQLGELAELAFMRKAASMGFAVAKPWGDSDRYDVIIRFEKMFWRVQVKSVITPKPSLRSYRVKTTRGANGAYSSDEIDFLAAYVFPTDCWYIFPAAMIEGRDSVCVRPEHPKCRLIQYREAWDLMKAALAGAAASKTCTALAHENVPHLGPFCSPKAADLICETNHTQK
ncbi:MAG: group I intron-associated PD-(D/E)XK endonuclease [Candidatus Sulfotelmatobacter sp.]